MGQKDFKPQLKPLAGKRKRKKNSKFAVCDVEAHDWTNFKLMGYYDGKEYQEFRTMYEFIEYIWEEMRLKKGIAEIYAHFGGIYDFMFILEELIRQGYEIDGMIPRGSGILCFSFWKTGYEDFKITVRDSSALFPFGLAKLTESFNVTHIKQDFDFEKWDGTITPQLCEYLRYDCVGLWECLAKYRTWHLIDKCGPATTMASQAMKVLRLFMTKPLTDLSYTTDKFIRRGYFGGRTEIFKPFYQGKKKLKCLDVNSLYPFVMRADMPGDFKCWTMNYEPEQMGYYEATVEVPKHMKIPPLPSMIKVGKSEKLIFPTGVFSGVFSTVELEYARSLGVKILSTGKGVLFHNYGGLFRGFIDELYRMRMEANEKGDGVTSLICKLLMNSCYGRFALTKEKEELLFDDFTAGLYPHCEIEVDGVFYPIMKRKKTLDSIFTNVGISAWVTSLARIHMHKIYMQCGDELYYTDTDSIFTTKDFPSGKELGELKLEYESNRAVFLLPKTYFVENTEDIFKKVAMKGFSSRKIKNFTFDDFFSALEGDLRHMRVVHDAKLATMKTAMKRFKTILAKMPKQEKALRSLYDKRLVYKEGGLYDSKPLHVQNGFIM